MLLGTVERPSVSGQEAQVAGFLVRWMSDHGFSAHVDEAGNAVGSRGEGSLTVVLLGHIDTVPGDIPVRIEQGVLHGRGSVDAKGSFCTFMAAVAELPDSVLARARFVCIGATEEEAPSSKGARFAVTRYRPDFVLIGEPSGAQGITLGYKGRLVVKAQVRKDNFHSAGEGTSAADDLTEYWFRVREWARTVSGKGAFDSVQATLQHLSSTTDGLSQDAEATIGLRLPPAVSPLQAEAALNGLLQDPNQGAGDITLGILAVSLSFMGHEMAVRHAKDSPLARALRVAIRAQGGEPIFKVKTGTSDMNVVAEHWPVPTLAYGPGDSRLDHTPQEHLPLDEYQLAVETLRDALVRLIGN
nr:[LysW]-lysine hydrolase [Deinococcus peraridilitoris]